MVAIWAIPLEIEDCSREAITRETVRDRLFKREKYRPWRSKKVGSGSESRQSLVAPHRSVRKIPRTIFQEIVAVPDGGGEESSARV